MEFVYRVNASDVITDVNDAWLEFALRNEAKYLTRARVVGSSLWDHVSGVETRQIYQLLFEHVRSGREVTIPFRCDSPEVRWFHEMRMTSTDAGGIELACRVLRQERQSPYPIALLEAGVFRSDAFVVMCSWCKKIKTRQDHWLELERAVKVMQLLSQPRLPQITHGMCRSCEETMSGV